MVFFPAVLWFVWAYFKCGIGGNGEERMAGWTWLLASCLINPCLVLIDHGHFQVGIVFDKKLHQLWIDSWMELVVATLFILSINHKQLSHLSGELLYNSYVLGMSFYFGPAFLGHLLGKCIKRKYPIVEVIKLDFVVLGTFALVWWPFLHSYEAAMQLFLVSSFLFTTLLVGAPKRGEHSIWSQGGSKSGIVMLALISSFLPANRASQEVGRRIYDPNFES
uniref:Alpha-1,3-glucosyltransferase n=1 Tax=Oryza punctata TaxID=4537 RepID=A0A0E0KD96_ORYPU